MDATTATDEAQNAAVAYAQAQPDYVAVRVESSMNPRLGHEGFEITADTLWMFNDPTNLILNVRFTGDLERHERAPGATWGGALCVSPGERTGRTGRLPRGSSRRARSNEPSVDERAGQVFLQAILEDGLQAELDQRWRGPGAG